MAKCMKIESIDQRGKELPDLHKDILGCECSFFQFDTRSGSALIITVPVTNSGISRKVMTSKIEKYLERDCSVCVETENTVYLFRESE